MVRPRTNAVPEVPVEQQRVSDFERDLPIGQADFERTIDRRDQRFARLRRVAPERLGTNRDKCDRKAVSADRFGQACVLRPQRR